MVDIAPTILDIAGLGIPRTYSGITLRPTMDHGAPTRPMLFANTYAFGSFPGVTGVNPRVSTAVRDSRFKYIRFDLPIHPAFADSLHWTLNYASFPALPNGTELLFDLQADPYERSDLSNHIAYHPILANLRAAADAWNERHRMPRPATP